MRNKLTFVPPFARLGALGALVLGGCERTPSGFIPDHVSCRDCEIIVEEVAVVGDTTADASLTGRPMAVWQDGTGRYWINVLDAFPMIYDPESGQLSEFARRGEGPGEYRHPMIRTDLPGDSMLVSDVLTYRVVTRGMGIAREIQGMESLPAIAVVQWPSSVLGITMPHDRSTGTVRTVVARYDFSGDEVSVVDTILATEPNNGAGSEWAGSIRLFGRPAPDSSLWISDFNRYRLVRYSSDGEPLDSVRRRPQWFPGGEPLRIGGPNQPTTPHLSGNWVDAKGRLWVLAAQPRDDTREVWKDAGAQAGAMEGRVASLPADYKLKRTIIEVIDLDTRRVIARRTFDGYVNAILSDQRVASFTETELGVPVLRIHRLTLRGADRADSPDS